MTAASTGDQLTVPLCAVGQRPLGAALASTQEGGTLLARYLTRFRINIGPRPTNLDAILEWAYGDLPRGGVRTPPRKSDLI